MARPPLTQFRKLSTRKLVVIAASSALALGLVGTSLGLARTTSQSSVVASPAVESSSTILSVARSAGTFKTLLAAVDAADLQNALDANGPFTVFAPTDAAFAKLPASTLAALLKPENKQALVSILTYHVAPGSISSVQAAGLNASATLNSAPLPISLRDGRLTVQNASVIKTDILASNGVIHVIDSVLLPPNFDLAALTSTAAAPMTTGKPMALIHAAIARGVPMYNDHQPQACAQIYEVAMIGLMSMDDASVPRSVKMALQASMSRAKNKHSWSDKAWACREGLDAAAEMLSREDTREMSGVAARENARDTMR